MKEEKRILIAPLDWGLGHATRCIPVIRALQTNGATVVIGADKAPLTLLQQEFPEVERIALPGYNISYPKSGNMAWKMVLETPKILSRIKQEHQQLQTLIDTHRIDAVISDNRFGLWSNKVPSIFITHQIHIQAPIMAGQLYRINRSYIEKFSECWVPDAAGDNNLSGNLSHHSNLPPNVHYIGPLSRFDGTAAETTPIYDLLLLLSGPEPQRTVFEQLLLQQVANSGLKVLLVRGLPDDEAPITHNNVTVKHHLPANELQAAILQSKLVVCRPGYSTLMDLAALGKPALFVPTPGQTEQEYLAQMHMEQGHFYAVKQKKLHLLQDIKHAFSYTGIQLSSNFERLNNRVQHLMATL